jgi:hypothetical protein
MTQTSQDELYRQALESEGGESVSAGARAAHVRVAIEAGRAYYVDLSAVPEEKRAAVVAEINELVRRAGRSRRVVGSPQPDQPKADTTAAAG